MNTKWSNRDGYWWMTADLNGEAEWNMLKDAPLQEGAIVEIAKVTGTRLREVRTENGDETESAQV